MVDDSHIWRLVSRKLSNEASPSELEELEELLKVHSKAQFIYEILEEWWRDGMPEISNKESEKILDRIRKKSFSLDVKLEKDKDMEESTPSKKLIPWYRKWGVAAAVLILIGWAAVYLYPQLSLTSKNSNISGQGIMSQISTQNGSKSKVVLPDGTRVHLNAGSNLTYNNEEFGKETRTVTLIGEAYFDVADDASHPFIIHAGKINIKVLGTAFDVKSYPDDPTIATTLIRGSIEVSFVNKSKKKIRLKPSQTLTVYNHSIQIEENKENKEPTDQTQKEFVVAPLKVMPDDSTIVATSWIDDKLAFKSQSFPELARQLERWYNVEIIFSDSSVKEYQFTGVFKNESLKQALKALKITAPFTYKIEGNKVYIDRNK